MNAVELNVVICMTLQGEMFVILRLVLEATTKVSDKSPFETILLKIRSMLMMRTKSII